MNYTMHRQYRLSLDVKMKSDSLDEATDILWTNRIVPDGVECDIEDSKADALRYDIEQWGFPCEKIGDFCFVNAISYTYLVSDFEATDDKEAMEKAESAEFSIKSYKFLNDEIEMDMTDFDAAFTVEEPSTSIKLYRKEEKGKRVEVEYAGEITEEYIEQILEDAYNALYHFGAYEAAEDFQSAIQEALSEIEDAESNEQKHRILDSLKESLLESDIYTEDMKKVVTYIEKYIDSNI